jgi:F420-dependent oxidoreductase-like protein
VRLRIVAEGQEGIGWPRFAALAARCEALGFEALFRSDHYRSPVGDEQRDCLDAWATLAGLAAVTKRIRLGTLVSPATFRHPSELAKVVATVDHISGGRVELGIGAGWFEREHAELGFPFPALDARMAMFAEQVEIVVGEWSGEPVWFAGEHYTLTGGQSLPRPLQRPHPPIVVGGAGGRRTVDVAVRFAAEYNTYYATPAQCRARCRRVREACERAGRDPGSIVFSLMTGFVLGEDRAALRRRGARVMFYENGGGDVDAFVAGHREDWLVGSPAEVVERLAVYADAGVDCVYLQHLDFEDDGVLELIAREVAPDVVATA